MATFNTQNQLSLKIEQKRYIMTDPAYNALFGTSSPFATYLASSMERSDLVTLLSSLQAVDLNNYDSSGTALNYREKTVLNEFLIAVQGMLVSNYHGSITGSGTSDGETEIYPGSLGTDDLADKSITADKLDDGLVANLTSTVGATSYSVNANLGTFYGCTTYGQGITSDVTITPAATALKDVKEAEIKCSQFAISNKANGGYAENATSDCMAVQDVGDLQAICLGKIFPENISGS